jgi:hypothetical protein
MVQINFAQKSVNLKVVYYGPGMSGKTTNLEVIHQRAPESNRGDLTSISTDGDRTLFFDYMPLDLGTVAGMRTSFQLYTVPGQVYYNSTRKLVLQGVDGIIFVADSSAAMLNQNIESLRNLEENLNEYGKSLATLPHVIQLNKRDLPDAMSVEELARVLNYHNVPLFEAIANTGQGVFPTLKALAASVLRTIMAESGAKAPFSAPTPGPPPPVAPARGAQEQGAGRPAAVPVGRAALPFAPAAQQHAPPVPMPAMGPVHAPAPAVHAGYGAQPPAGGGGFFAGPAARHAPTPLAPTPGPAGGELQLAQPSTGHARSRSTAGFSAAPPASAPSRKPAPEPRRPARTPQAEGAPVASPRARAVKQPTATAEKAPSRAGEIFTGLFVVVGAGVGAFLAWVVMTVL